MRLANKALVAALAMLVLCAAVSAQTLRNENDPRNQSPSVGTGGPEGGATGLFTIYDGSTIRKGEFTFSIAYSNYDRDPGNADIVDIPLSFNVGLNDHIELWFKTNGYRGIKVNSPAHLSGFYLPNISILCGTATPSGLCSGPAIVQGPSGPNVGTIAGNAVFRPIGNQPFVNFPFSGGSAGTFGEGPGVIGGLFGFPGFNAQLGPPVSSSGSGTFGSADNFPGIGSVVGGILPGVVLATVQLPCTALTGNCRPPGSPGSLNPITVPTVFTIAPSYLPDAPFIGREYGESSFTNLVAGAKIRFTGPNNPLGVAVIPFYRWYPDRADGVEGFRQMQRGAGPGADLGDFGLIGVVDARLSRSVNVSANIGYILNSNPKGTFPTGEFVLLDRPNELLAGIGFDFPVSKHVQPVIEVRSTQYVGSRTPNAFENSPVEVLAGVKIYPRRWWGIGAAWRYHINQQDKSMFAGTDFNTQINNLSGVAVPGRGIIIVPGTTRSATSGSFPNGFTPSADANGFIGQFWIGHRNDRAPSILPNQPPTVSLSTSSATVTMGCPEGTVSKSGCTASSNQVQLSAAATDPDGDTLLYTYSVTGGRVTGDGPNSTWDLTGVTPGTYTASVEVDDGCGCVAFSSTTVTVASCTDCEPPCPTISIACPTDAVQPGSPATVSVNLSGGGNFNVTYNWTVSAGTISSGQGTPSITVDTAGQGGQNITATVEVGGLPPECDRTRSCSFSVVTPVQDCRKFDSYGDIRFNDEKARLDPFAVALQNEPGATGYIIAYGTCEGDGPCTHTSCIVAAKRAERAKDYLVNTRGIDAGRIVIIDGGCRAEVTVDLVICPAGATAPTPDMGPAVSPCPECKKTPVRRRPRRRRGEEE
ncbi:MAG: hypothetical protein QOD75_3422 [Blastocatellia bacterium]|nr:hypothetical protein [Blastocatellia bacterium]